MQRRFKEGVGSGRDTTDRRVRQERLKQKDRSQSRLRMRRSVLGGATDRSLLLGIDLEPRFREVCDQAQQALTRWYGGAEALGAVWGLQQVLCFPDRELVLSAYPQFFGGERGVDLLQRLAAILRACPRAADEAQLFRLALSCVTEIMYDPKNVAQVEVLCSAGAHESALRWLSADAGLSSELRQELLGMLGNTARNNQYARSMLLSSEPLVGVLAQNLQDAVVQEDWSLTSATLYMMYVLCENSHGGKTPPLAYFEPAWPWLLSVLAALLAVSDQERSPPQSDSALAALSFFESVALNTSLLDGSADSEELAVQQRRGVVIMASTPQLLSYLAYCLRSRDRQLNKKAASTISFMGSAGVDAIQSILQGPAEQGPTDLLFLLVSLLGELRTEAYAVRHVLRFIFLLTKYADAYTLVLLESGALEAVCALLVGGRGRTLNTQQSTYALYALHCVCTMQGEPLALQRLYQRMCNEYLLPAALSHGLRGCVQAGDLETCENVVDALASLLTHCPALVRRQMEEQDAINLLSRIQHVAHVDSPVYRKAAALENTYFADY